MSKAVVIGLTGLHLSAYAPPSFAQLDMVDAPSCFPSDGFAQIASMLGDNVVDARVYFKSDVGPDFFYVEMVPGAGGWEATLPQAATPPTSSVDYYIETRDAMGEFQRTPDFNAPVSDSCAGRKLPLGSNPSIVVGTSVAGVTAGVPTGFSPAGIVGFVNSAGVTTSLGAAAAGASGAGAGAAGAAGAAAATAGGAGIAGAGLSTSLIVGGLVAAGVAGVTVIATSGSDPVSPASP